MPDAARYSTFICVGSGPAGQKAAIQAAKAGFRAAIIERESQVGGSCLLSGTIPSKALREQALRYRRMQGSASSLAVELRGDAPLSALLHGVDAVIAAQDRYLQAQLARNQVELIRGRGVFLDANRIEVQRLDGSRSVVRAPRVLLATGSRPRHVAAIEVDHEHILDSDSILSLPYMPALDGGARQRRHRLRVRVHLCRAGLRGDPARQGGGAAGVSRSGAAQRISRCLPGDGRRVLGRRGSRRRALRRLLAGGSAAEGRPGIDRRHRVRRVRPRGQSGRHRPRPAAARHQQPRPCAGG